MGLPDSSPPFDAQKVFDDSSVRQMEWKLANLFIMYVLCRVLIFSQESNITLPLQSLVKHTELKAKNCTAPPYTARCMDTDTVWIRYDDTNKF